MVRVGKKALEKLTRAIGNRVKVSDLKYYNN